MAGQGLSGGVHVVVLDAEVSAGLLHNGSDLGVVGLDDPREQVVGGLVIQGAREHGPEPTASSIVLRGGYLKLSPADKKGTFFFTVFMFSIQSAQL